MLVFIEGPDGSGKTTIANALVERLQGQGIGAIYYREPGGTAIGEEIRDVLLRPRSGKVDPITELLLFFAARRQGMVEVLTKAEDRVIVIDRFILSSLAYQVYGRGVDMDLFLGISRHVLAELPEKKVSFFIDVPVEVANARKVDRGTTDRMELEDDEYHTRVRQGYYDIIESGGHEYNVINGNQSKEQVLRDVMNILGSALDV